MAFEIAATYVTGTGIKVGWDISSLVRNQLATTLERKTFVNNYSNSSDLKARKAWPYSGYAAEIEDISSLTGTDGNFGVRFAINSIPDLE